MTLEEINRCDREGFVARLGQLFEHSPWVAEETFGKGPFADARTLHLALCRSLRQASIERHLALIRAHPDLAGRLSRAGDLTAASQAEQASAGLDRLSGEEEAALAALNSQYRARFGFPFVICARLNNRHTLLAALEQRLGNTPEEEQQTALEEIEKIAWLRLQNLLEE